VVADDYDFFFRNPSTFTEIEYIESIHSSGMMITLADVMLYNYSRCGRTCALSLKNRPAFALRAIFVDYWRQVLMTLSAGTFEGSRKNRLETLTINEGREQRKDRTYP
jgi:hypothetical protein